MSDPRHQKLAQVLIHYSLALKPRDKLLILTQPAAAPLIYEIYRAALQVGAYPVVRLSLGTIPSPFALDGWTELKLREGNDDQLRYLSELDKQEVEYHDALLMILATDNTKGLSGIDPARIALLQQTHAPLFKRFLERAAADGARWCYTLYPTSAQAQDAGMSLEDYERFVFGAGLLDHDDPAAAWRAVHAQQQHIAD
ncbi:MAG TPA: aminopeptidase, partial [Chloroflexota bacterium]|nr:aminopeptidase [Chloroflexota bacterium]